MANSDRPVACRFGVRIAGGGPAPDMSFAGVSGLTAEPGVTAVREDGESRSVHRLRGRTIFRTLVLQRGIALRAHRHSLTVTMSQTSSVPQGARAVPPVLVEDCNQARPRSAPRYETRAAFAAELNKHRPVERIPQGAAAQAIASAAPMRNNTPRIPVLAG